MMQKGLRHGINHRPCPPVDQPVCGPRGRRLSTGSALREAAIRKHGDMYYRVLSAESVHAIMQLRCPVKTLQSNTVKIRGSMQNGLPRTWGSWHQRFRAGRAESAGIKQSRYAALDLQSRPLRWLGTRPWQPGTASGYALQVCLGGRRLCRCRRSITPVDDTGVLIARWRVRMPSSNRS